MLSKQKPPVCQVYYYQYQKLKTKEQRRKDDLTKSRNPRGIWYVDERSYKQIQKIEAAEKAEDEKRKLSMKAEEERVRSVQLKVKDHRREKLRLQDEESFQSYKDKYNDLYQEHTLMKKKLEDLEKMVTNKDKYINALNKAFKDVFEKKEALSKKPEKVDVLTQTEHLMIDFGVQCHPEMTSKYIGTERKYYKGREVQTEKVKGREFSCQKKAININKVEVGTMATQTTSACAEIPTMTDNLMVTDKTDRIPLIAIEKNDVGTMTTQTLSTCVESSTMTDSPQMVTGRTARVPLIPIEKNDLTIAIQKSSTCVDISTMIDSSLMVTDQTARKPLISIEKKYVGTMTTEILSACVDLKNVVYPRVNIIGYNVRKNCFSDAMKTSPATTTKIIRYRSFDIQPFYISGMFQFKISFYEMKMIFDKLYLVVIKFMQMYHRQQDIPVAEVSIATVFIPHDCYKHQKQINCLTNVLPKMCFNGEIHFDDIIDIHQPQKQIKSQETVYQDINGCMMKTLYLNQRMINLIRIFLVYVKIIKYHGKMLLLNCASMIDIGWNVLQVIRLLTYICNKTINVDILEHQLFTNLRYNISAIFKLNRYTSSAVKSKPIISQAMIANMDVNGPLSSMNKMKNRIMIEPLLQKDFIINREHCCFNNGKTNCDQLGSLETYGESLTDPIIFSEPRSTPKKSNCFVRLYNSLKSRKRVKTTNDDNYDEDL